MVDSSNGDLEWVDNADDLAATNFVLGTITYVVDGDNALSSASFVQADGIDTANGIRFWEDESFSQAEINDGLIRFVHSGDDKDANDAKDGRQAQFTYVLRDAGKPKADQVIGAEQTVDVTIGQVDDRPFIDDSLDDGNSDKKTADVAARTLLENTPQDHPFVKHLQAMGLARQAAQVQADVEDRNAGSGDADVWQTHRDAWKEAYDAYQATKGDFMGSLATRGLSQADIDDINAKIGAMDRGAQKYLVETTSLQTDTGTIRGDHFAAWVALMNDLKGHNIFPSDQDIVRYVLRTDITLTNAMFGVVDTDSADSDVTITLMGRDGIDATDIQSTAAYVSADGQVSIAGRAAGVIQRQIVNGDNPATTDVTETDFTGWVNSGSFTLAELKAGHVRFVQDVRFEFGDGVDPHINLFIARLASTSGTKTVARVYDHLAAASTGDEINLVRLFVTPADDAPIERSVDEPTAVTGAPVPTADEEAPITEDGEAYILRTSDLAFEDYDLPRDGVLTYQNIDVANLSVGGTAHARLQKNIAAQGQNADWQDHNSGWTTFTLAELEAGLIRLVQTGVNPEGTNSQQVVTFTYDVHSSQNGLQNSGNVFTLTIDGVNDVPSDMQANTTRIASTSSWGDAVAQHHDHR